MIVNNIVDEFRFKPGGVKIHDSNPEIAVERRQPVQKWDELTMTCQVAAICGRLLRDQNQFSLAAFQKIGRLPYDIDHGTAPIRATYIRY